MPPQQRLGRPRIDLTGERFGMLVAVERVQDPTTGYWNRWRCVCDCGGEKIAPTGSLRRYKYGSCGCRSRGGANNGRWKGGRRKVNGYVRVWRPGHPRAVGNYVLEHLLVMEEALGRPVEPHEEVHHKNGVRDANRLENLELWVKSQPPGQRVEDLVTWATTLLKKYAPETLR